MAKGRDEYEQIDGLAEALARIFEKVIDKVEERLQRLTNDEREIVALDDERPVSDKVTSDPEQAVRVTSEVIPERHDDAPEMNPVPDAGIMDVVPRAERLDVVSTVEEPQVPEQPTVSDIQYAGEGFEQTPLPSPTPIDEASPEPVEVVASQPPEVDLVPPGVVDSPSQVPVPMEIDSADAPMVDAPPPGIPEFPQAMAIVESVQDDSTAAKLPPPGIPGGISSPQPIQFKETVSGGEEWLPPRDASSPAIAPVTLPHSSESPPQTEPYDVVQSGADAVRPTLDIQANVVIPGMPPPEIPSTEQTPQPIALATSNYTVAAVPPPKTAADQPQQATVVLDSMTNVGQQMPSPPSRLHAAVAQQPIDVAVEQPLERPPPQPPAPVPAPTGQPVTVEPVFTAETPPAPPPGQPDGVQQAPILLDADRWTVGPAAPLPVVPEAGPVEAVPHVSQPLTVDRTTPLPVADDASAIVDVSLPVPDVTDIQESPPDVPHISVVGSFEGPAGQEAYDQQMPPGTPDSPARLDVTMAPDSGGGAVPVAPLEASGDAPPILPVVVAATESVAPPQPELLHSVDIADVRPVETGETREVIPVMPMLETTEPPPAARVPPVPLESQEYDVIPWVVTPDVPRVEMEPGVAVPAPVERVPPPSPPDTPDQQTVVASGSAPPLIAALSAPETPADKSPDPFIVDARHVAVEPLNALAEAVPAESESTAFRSIKIIDTAPVDGSAETGGAGELPQMPPASPPLSVGLTPFAQDAEQDTIDYAAPPEFASSAVISTIDHPGYGDSEAEKLDRERTEYDHNETTLLSKVNDFQTEVDRTVSTIVGTMEKLADDISRHRQRLESIERAFEVNNG